MCMYVFVANLVFPDYLIYTYLLHKKTFQDKKAMQIGVIIVMSVLLKNCLIGKTCRFPLQVPHF